jgi:hypothetical protein
MQTCAADLHREHFIVVHDSDDAGPNTLTLCNNQTTSIQQPSTLDANDADVCFGNSNPPGAATSAAPISISSGHDDAK